MRLLATALAAMLITSPAFAQAGPGMSDPITAPANLSQLSPTHRYWESCLTGEGEVAVRGCGRVIGARVSRMHTATAHYFRSIALQALGEDERALRDLRRAYFTFGDLVFENENNAVARYGRGLSLQRMGHDQEAEQEMSRAIANSQGEASHFFEING
ncbi:MAG: tetratricopeptide repeat protein [Hyphomonadaceae bacterium]